MPGARRIIGVDESGKGDFFGPLVIAAFLSSDADHSALVDMGVRDGKRLSQQRVLAIDDQLRAVHPHYVVVIDPEDYNLRYRRIRNLNRLLAQGHAAAISGILKSHPADLVLVDQFGKPELIHDALADRHNDVTVKQRFRGEEIIQVAAASVIARAAFLRAIESLSQQYEIELPRGAAPQVDRAGRELVRRFGPEVLATIAKTHFKNYRRATDLSLLAE